MIEHDGSFGEGGGQVLRTCLALSALTGKAFHLCNVRAGRRKPGLLPQHLASTLAAAAICHAEVRGAELHSRDLVFDPHGVEAGLYEFPIKTAGALSLVLHTVYLPLALRGARTSQIVLRGGTHVKASPTYEFLESTWAGYMRVLGLEIGLMLDRPGFYPRGGGKVYATVQPCTRMRGLRLESLTLEKRARGVAATAGLPQHISQRMAKRARERLHALNFEFSVAEGAWHAGPGAVLTLVLETKPVPTLFTGVGERGKPAEKVADDVIDQILIFLSSSPPGIDAHSADQLILPLALAEEPSSFRVATVTRHLKTNIAAIRQFVDRDITCSGEEGQPGTVTFGPI
jgi:RNA 3'-terminal phosphate cyclase (ATP)